MLSRCLAAGKPRATPKDSAGPARYRRTVDVPADWDEQRVMLEFDAVSYACTVLVNGVVAGQHVGMWTPFAIDVSAHLRPGSANEIELEVYKPGGRYPMRSSLAGFLPDVATTFGGIWQSCRLLLLPVALDDLLVDTDPSAGEHAGALRYRRCRPASACVAGGGGRLWGRDGRQLRGLSS